MRWHLLSLAVLLACQKPSGGEPPTNDSTPADEPALVGPHDGRYVVGFHRDGGQFALGAFTIARNQLSGELRSDAGLSVAVEGRVKADGSLEVSALTSDPVTDLSLVSGRAGDGVVEGVYRIDGQEGRFSGTLDGRLRGQDPSSLFDGTYAIALTAGDEEIGATVVEVKQGRLTTTVAVASGFRADIRGVVTDDGTIVLLDASNAADWAVLAEANIDHEDGSIEGIFRAESTVGRLTGRRSD